MAQHRVVAVELVVPKGNDFGSAIHAPWPSTTALRNDGEPHPNYVWEISPLQAII